MRRRYPLLLVFCMAAALLHARTALAGCSACEAGDPSVSAIGIPEGSGLGVVAGIGGEIQRNTAGTNQIGYSDQYAQEMYFRALWTVAPTFRIQLQFPWWRKDLTEEGQHWLDEGFGDATLTGTLTVWKDPGMSFGQSVNVTGGITAPTGQRIPGSNEHAQPGQGMYSGIVGAGWFSHYQLWRFYLSTLYRANTPNIDRYRYGNIWMGNAGVQHEAWPDWLDGSLELNARDVGIDHDQDGFVVDNTGGTVVYLTPGVMANLGRLGPNQWFLRAAVQVPIINVEVGIQHPGPVGQLGLNAAF